MTGCAGIGAQGTRRPAPGGAELELLYYADTLDALEPSIPVVCATRLGPAHRIGRAPWATGPGIQAIAGAVSAPDLTTPRQATGQRLGGYATLAAMLAEARQRFGPDRCLTLENGQCWNGAGAGYLSQGEIGVAASQLFASDVRVSSDERLLWPAACATLYHRYARPVVGVRAADDAQPPIAPQAIFERGGARIAVVGATDPYASDEARALDAWYLAIEAQVATAREQADLVVVLADTGTGPGVWLAQRLEQADLLLCARGQDWWPALVEINQTHGGTIPVCFAGSRGIGLYRIRARSQSGQWRFEAQFQAADSERLSAPTRARQQRFQATVSQWRAPYAEWLDRPLGRVPQWLWRRDTSGGSWDSLIAEALTGGDPTLPTLSPGLRHDVILPPQTTVTRDHLLALSGGHEARVFTLALDGAALQNLLERAADQCFGAPTLLDNSEDLPRVTGVEWACRYAAGTGQRIRLTGATAEREFITWSVRPQAQGGEPLWQLMERYLAHRGAAPLAPPSRPRMQFVEGHPGWHPELRLES